jgi:PKD repeat protein
MALLYSGQALAQVQPQFYVSTFTGGANSFPFNAASGNGSKVQWLYAPGQFKDASSKPAFAGLITSIYIYAASGSGSHTFTNLKIEIGHTTTTSLSSGTWHSGLQTCLNQNVTLTGVGSGQWFEIELNKPFLYDPKKYLIVSIENHGMSGGFTVNQDRMTFNARMYGDRASSTSAGADATQVVMGIDLRVPGPDNAGVVAIDSPFVFCGGTQNIYATIGNYGSNQIKSLTVNWSLDGVAQTPISYTNTLDTFGGKGANTAQIKLGSATFNSKRTLLVFTSNPNGIADKSTANDSIETTLQPSLQGTFSIGGAKSQYASIAAAANDLTNFGVCGPVTFYVRPGTYNGQVKLGEIQGASATNNIRFISASTDSVTIAHNTDGTVSLQGADYVSFDKFYIRATGTSGAAVHLAGGADYNRFSDCIIEANLSSTSSTLNPLVISSSSTSASGYGNNGNYNLFEDNDIRGGYYGVINVGTSTSSMSEGNSFLRNNMNRSYYYGIRFYYVSGGLFHDNVIKDLRNTYNYGIYAYYVSNFDWQRNKVIGAYYGNYFAYANYYNYKNKRSIFANNSLAGANTSYGMYAYYMSYTDFYHNSIYGEGSYLMYWYYMNNIDIRNNIFYYQGTNYMIYTYNPTLVNWDYNDYVLKGGNLCYITGTVYPTLSSLQGWNANYNQNSWELDPEWVDEKTDHHVTKDFPEMYGPYVGVDVDFDQDDRCKFVATLGPDEFTKSSLPPRANFLVPDTAWLGATTLILNSNAPSKTEGALWYLNGKLVSDSIHLEYKPTTAGYDTVMLKMFNCGGQDSVTKVVYVSPILRAPKVDFSASKRATYTGETISLFDLTENGSTQWQWSIDPVYVYSSFLLIRDRTHFWEDSTVANPRVTFNYPGAYRVCLKVGNQFGADSICRTQYILVREAAKMCDITNFSEAEYGTLYDDGGATGNYTPGSNGFNQCNYSISTCKGQYKLHLNTFDLAENDYLRIYDGADETGKPLWDAATYPNGMTGLRSNASVTVDMVATTGSVYVEFESDNNAATVGKGFSLDWELDPVSWSSPSANFSFPDTACVGFATYFENTSTGIYGEVEWDVDANGTVEGYGNQFGYTFNTTGTYDVMLKAKSYCADNDSVVKQIVIINAAKAPSPDFTASGTKVSVGDTVSLNDMSQYCSNFTEWTITPANYILANNTNLNTGQLDVLFTKGGFYTIELTKGNTFGKDSVIKTNYIQVLQYCLPNVVNLDPDLGISRVAFGTIDHKSQAGRSAYGNYLQYSTEVERGLTYPITIERTTNTKEMSRKVWIDWNIDGDFDDAGEMVLSEASSTQLVLNDSIRVPASATPGITRMRVSTNYKNLSNLACGPHNFGEFEDYSIVISEQIKTPPVIVLDGAIIDTVEVNSSWTEPGYKARSIINGNITNLVQVTNPLDISKVGTYVLTYSVTDSFGNSASTTRTIRVIDSKLPSIALVGADTITIEINTGYSELGTTASDNYDASLNVVKTGNVDTTNIGEYSINYCVTDASGNGPVCVTRIVIVEDTQSPVITLVGNENVTVEQCGSYTELGYNVTDNGSVTVSTTSTWPGNSSERGVYTITYTATDGGGNTASVTRNITVEDTEAPVVKLIGNSIDTVDRWEEYVDPGYTASDYCNDESEVTVTVGGTFKNTQSEGLFTITYVATDASSNTSSTLVRHIWVVAPLSVNNTIKQNVTVYPNPSNGQFNLVVNSDLENATVTIIDQSGKEFTVANAVNGNVISIDASWLNSGTYFVKVADSESVSVQRIVISK